MSTIQSDLDRIPAWKRDLILRKRSKSYGALPAENGLYGGIPPPMQHPAPRQQIQECSVQGPASQLGSGQHVNQSTLASGCSNKSVSSSGNEGNDIYSKSRIVTSAIMKAPSSMQPKMRLGDSPKRSWTEEQEELEYGPGIVSRLKNRYMTIAMRESKGRPSLRKYSSLEDLLDDEGPAWQERGRPVQKVRPSQGGSPLRREAMKRTRSMDSLALRRNESQEKMSKSMSSGGLRKANLDALGKEDIIIIETTRPSNDNKIHMQTVPEHVPELPKKSGDIQVLPVPDLVKQVKQIFEPMSSRTGVRGTAAKVAAYKAAQARKNSNGTLPTTKPQVPANKPSLKAKPVITKKPISPTEEIKKPALNKPTKPTPKSTMSVKPMPPVNKVGVLSPSVTGGSGLTPITASVTAPCVNGFKKVSSSAISNIRNQSQHQEFDFTSKDTTDAHQRPHSPVTPLPPSPTLSPRIPSSPIKENHRVLQENKKNSEKSKPFQQVQPNNSKVVTPQPLPSETKKPLRVQITNKPSSPPNKSPITSPVTSPFEEKHVVITERTKPTSPVVVETVKPVPSREELRVKTKDTNSIVAPSVAPKSESSSPVKSAKNKDGKWHQQQDTNTSLVFNFSKRADTPDYIENDGVDLSKRQFPSHDAGYVIMPGYDGKTDSSTDDFDEDYLDSRGGAGSLAPQPCHVVFEGDGVIINGRSNLQRQPRTKKLEISFDLVSTQIFEYPSESSLVEEYLFDDLQTTNTSSGGLASYTPSKLPLSNSFELGVSRSAQPPTPPKEKSPVGAPISDHLRPADENETIIWSAESAPDMLF